MCKQEYSSDNSTIIYTRKELVMMETTIYDIHTSLYIPAIQKLAFHLPHVRIIVKNCCGAIRRTAFKQLELSKYVLCCRDYSERVVTSFANQIQPKYHYGNISVSTEGIALEYFSALPKIDINSIPSIDTDIFPQWYFGCIWLAKLVTTLSE